MENKRGELTSKQLITIIILIISFAIIIAFFVMLNLRETIDAESCRNSVIMRGSLPGGTDVVQLKCKTQDVCLSMGEDCEVSRKDMITLEVDTEEELMQEMVDLLWDCWWMMGEGKIDYMSKGIGWDETYCSICDKVYFDSEIQENYLEGISYVKIYDYMTETQMPQREETYLYSIYGLDSLSEVRESVMGETKVDIYDYKINPVKEHIVITSIMKTTSVWEIGASAGGFVAGVTVGFIFPVGGHVVLTPLVYSATASALGMIIGPPDTKYMVPRYLEFDGKELEALDCKEYVTEI